MTDIDILFARDLATRRAQQKVTVLRGRTLTLGQVGALVNGLMTEAKTLRDVCVLFGEYSREQIAAILPEKDLEIEVAVGLDNPNLPFKLTGW